MKPSFHGVYAVSIHSLVRTDKRGWERRHLFIFMAEQVCFIAASWRTAADFMVHSLLFPCYARSICLKSKPTGLMVWTFLVFDVSEGNLYCRL
jgi:hypothetical protein